MTAVMAELWEICQKVELLNVREVLDVLEVCDEDPGYKSSSLHVVLNLLSIVKNLKYLGPCAAW